MNMMVFPSVLSSLNALISFYSQSTQDHFTMKRGPRVSDREISHIMKAADALLALKS